MTYNEAKEWKETKAKGLNLFTSEGGGSYKVFNTSPLLNDVMLYCIQDVQYMPKLWSCFNSKLTSTWASKVEIATKERVTLSQSQSFNRKEIHMALGPLEWT